MRDFQMKVKNPFSKLERFPVYKKSIYYSGKNPIYIIFFLYVVPITTNVVRVTLIVVSSELGLPKKSAFLKKPFNCECSILEKNLQKDQFFFCCQKLGIDKLIKLKPYRSIVFIALNIKKTIYHITILL